MTKSYSPNLVEEVFSEGQIRSRKNMIAVNVTAPAITHSSFPVVRSSASSAPVSHYPSLLASALGGVPDVDRTCQGFSEGKDLFVFVLNSDDPVQGSYLPDFQ